MAPIPEILTDSDTIFHYTKLSTAFEYILWSHTLKFFNKKNTDDPFEYHKPMIGGCSASDKNDRATIDKYGREAFYEIHELIHEKSKILCFCKNSLIIHKNEVHFPDEFGFMKLRMWSQYGEKHRGVCLAFSRKKLLAELGGLVGIKYYAEDVKYHQLKDYLMIHHSINADDAIKSGVTKYIYDYFDLHYERLFFWKHTDYKDETEFRVCVIPKENTIDGCNIDSSLIGIILGDSYPRYLLPSIREIQEKYNTKLFQMDLEFGFCKLPQIKEL